MNVKIVGTAKTGYQYPQELNGIECEDNFADYIRGSKEWKHKVKEGFMHFEWRGDSLWAVTEYELNEAMTPAELQELKDYTVGQWSDGIGEVFEQEPCAYRRGEEVHISAWHQGQEVFIDVP